MKYITLFLLLLGTYVNAIGNTRIIIQEKDFSKPKPRSYWVHKKTIAPDPGGAILTVATKKKYNSSLLMFKASAKIPSEEADQKLELKFTVNAFSDALAKKNNAELRVFFAPDSNKYGHQPYNLPYGIIISLSPQKDGSVQIALYLKKNKKNSLGKRIYSGMALPGCFPLTTTLLFDKDSYRLGFNREVEPGSGGRSGHWKLENEIWQRPAFAGMRLLNMAAEHRAQVKLGEVSLKEITFE